MSTFPRFISKLFAFKTGLISILQVITDFYDYVPDIGDFEIGAVADIQHHQRRIDEITIRDDVRRDSSSRNQAYDTEIGVYFLHFS
jgi:hypothetical protein